MERLFPEDIDLYTREHTSPASPLLEELERETREKVPGSQMLTGRVEGTLLRMLVRISGARRVVDIGTYTGYSALMMAEGLPEDGELITCEVSEAHADIARRYFLKSPHGGKIRLALGPALVTLSELQGESVDLVFIDADKTSYPAYYEESMRILRRGGLIAVDNVLWSGRVLAGPRDEDTGAIIAFNEQVRKDERVEKVMLTVRDGVYIIRKR
jgi:caffeoyl-CoA O-methyltransferase